MADFDLVHVPTAYMTWVEWTDPLGRINPLAGRPHRYLAVQNSVVSTLEFNAVVGGVQAPTDASLGGRLFSWAWVDWHNYGISSPPPLLSPIAGKTSRATVTVVGAQTGLGLIQCIRDTGGSILFPFVIVTP
jgi:hypothetical protein